MDGQTSGGETSDGEEGGGCLIATAAYGSEIISASSIT